MAKFEERRPIKCSFCGKTQESVKKIIAGPGVYICNECGYQTQKWMGKCPACNEWNSFYEEKVVSNSSSNSSKKKEISKPIELNKIEEVPMSSKLEEILQKMQEDMEVKPEDVVKKFEQEQEEKAIISYQELVDNENVVYEVLASEKTKFNRTLEKGLREFEKVTRNNEDLDGQTAFRLFDTFGFPLELTVELAQERGYAVDENGFKAAFEEHPVDKRFQIEISDEQ